MFEHVQGYLQVYRALVGKQSGTIVAEHLQQMITDLVRNDLAALAPHDGAMPIPLELVVQQEGILGQHFDSRCLSRLHVTRTPPHPGVLMQAQAMKRGGSITASVWATR
jgi:hypothetical protein